MTAHRQMWMWIVGFSEVGYCPEFFMNKASHYDKHIEHGLVFQKILDILLNYAALPVYDGIQIHIFYFYT